MRSETDVFDKYSETAIKNQLGVEVSENPPGSEAKVRKDYQKSDLKHEELARSKLSRENLERVYRELLGIEPTEKEIEAAIHLGSVLRIGDGDPLWHILLTQQHFASITAAAHKNLQGDIKHIQALLKAIEEASLKAQGDANLLPGPLMKRLPSLLRAIFTFSSAKMILTFAALVISIIAINKSDNQLSTIQSESIEYLATCFGGRGDIKTANDGSVYCVLKPDTELRIEMTR